ncbi:MAG: sugar ABC transporter substrate-binding protein [Lachnospiraceae bacterium]|nr:sugar ABC transporter substrate-binding protein [Lachnospiraceae bacterium]
MKRRVLAVLMSAVLVGALMGCGGGSSSGGASSAATPAAEASTAAAPAAEASTAAAEPAGEASYSVDVILKTLASEYWSYVKAGCDAYAADHPNVKVDVKGPASEQSYDEQQNMIETDLSSGAYDAFVIAPLQGDQVANLISGQSAPILAVDTNIDAPEVLSFVGTANEDAAKQGGLAAVAAAQAAGWEEVNAICIAGTQGDSTAQARLDGYQKGVEEAGGTFLANETQWGESNPEKAVAAMEAIMQNHPEGVAIIVCHNDDSAIAAAKAVKDSGNEVYANTIFCGFDGTKTACKAIIAGDETMSVAQEAFDMGYKAVEAAVAALEGETLDPFIDSGCSVVDSSNAQSRLDQLNVYYPE